MADTKLQYISVTGKQLFSLRVCVLTPPQTHTHKQAIMHKHEYRLIQTDLLLYLAKIRLSLL